MKIGDLYEDSSDGSVLIMIREDDENGYWFYCPEDNKEWYYRIGDLCHLVKIEEE
tara:strand:+ start:1907 stop:2071 length:165 start_codon:yes stop_codon:yes gene_type:complete